MDRKTKSVPFATLLSVALLLTLAAAPQMAGNVTKIRVTGLAAEVLVENPDGGSGYLNCSKDQVANTTALDFAWAIPHPTDPELIIMFQGAGEIPNTACTITKFSAHLALTTPDSLPVVRCVVNINTGEFTCEPTGPITFDLTWARNDLLSIYENTKRTETLGPVTTKFAGEFNSWSATVSGTWDGAAVTHLTGRLYDTGGKYLIREITLAANP